MEPNNLNKRTGRMFLLLAPALAVATLLALLLGARFGPLDWTRAEGQVYPPAPTGSISGTVTGPGGVPIEGAIVSASVPDFGQAITAADGTYTITGLSSTASGDPRGYVVWASAPGFATEYFDNVADPADSTEVFVLPNEETANIDFSLETEGTISGVVTGPSGPIEGARVTACMSGPCYSALTDPGGVYTIRSVPPDSYRVWVCATGYACEFFDDMVDSATPVAVVAGEETSDIDFDLVVEGTISGVVTDADGPVEGVNIIACANAPLFCAPTVYTAADGSYTAGGLATSNYRVEAVADGYVAEVYDDKPSFGTGDDIPVTAGSNTPNINFLLEGQGSISGTVTGPDGPIEGASVFAELIGDSFVASGTTTADGSYIIEGLSDGSYFVHVLNVLGYFDEYYEDASDGADATPVLVTAGENTPDINLLLNRIEVQGFPGTVDQQNSLIHDPDGGYCSTLYPVGQTFVPQADNISAFDIYLQFPTGDVVFGLEILAWPGGPALATINTTLELGVNHIVLPTPVSLSPGEKYAILINQSAPYYFCTVQAGEYEHGCFVEEGAEACSQSFGLSDMFFRTYYGEASPVTSSTPAYVPDPATTTPSSAVTVAPAATSTPQAEVAGIIAPPSSGDAGLREDSWNSIWILGVFVFVPLGVLVVIGTRGLGRQ
jgi:hypothetical protein